jgi:predicted aspartyl protease
MSRHEARTPPARSAYAEREIPRRGLGFSHTSEQPASVNDAIRWAGLAHAIVVAGVVLLASAGSATARTSKNDPPNTADAAQAGSTFALKSGSTAALLYAAAVAQPASTHSAPAHAGATKWPDGTVVLPFEDLEGLPLLHTTIRGANGWDSSGVLVLDTGAGYLALDREVAIRAGLIGSDSSDSSATTIPSIGLADQPLSRLQLGPLQLDQVSPVLTIDAEIIRAVTDRDVFGLLGRSPLADRAVGIDYVRDEIALIPGVEAMTGGGSHVAESRLSLGHALGTKAVPFAFREVGDGKILLHVNVGADLTLVLDTGATKCALFSGTLARKLPESARWRSVRGLAAPTLIGISSARIVMVPEMALVADSSRLVVRDLDAAVMDTELESQLSEVAGENVDGLLGASFLHRFYVLIDYPHSVLWLEPIPGWKNPRPYEYSHIGVQLERHESVMRVVGVAEHSPAADAGIARGDELVSVDGARADSLDVSELTRRLEGAAGTRVVIVVRNEKSVRTLNLKRQSLL